MSSPLETNLPKELEDKYKFIHLISKFLKQYPIECKIHKSSNVDKLSKEYIQYLLDITSCKECNENCIKICNENDERYNQICGGTWPFKSDSTEIMSKFRLLISSGKKLY